MFKHMVSAKHAKYETDRERRIHRRRSLSTELNVEFIKYYKSVLGPLLHSEENWKSFLDILSVPLQLVFRVTVSNSLYPELVTLLRDLHVVKQCNTLPNGIAYECTNADFDIPRIKKILQDLHASGVITFQESVSMIPAVALVNALKKRPLESQSRDWYLVDSCAAPASKSLHLLDMMHMHRQFRGVLLCVEFDRVKATQHLPARLKRSQSPCAIAIHGDATRLPRLFSEIQGRFIDFDGVLCDVPCSGDGTCRKDNTIQVHWDASYATKLHPKQCAILRRGIEQLRASGICVYSTCSLNPVENECVLVQNIMHERERLPVTVCNIRELVPDFCFTSGVILDAAAHVSNEYWSAKDTRPMLQGEDTDLSCQNVCNRIGIDLSYIGRVLPHSNNTGGFFTATLQRMSRAETGTDRNPMVDEAKKSFSHWGGYKRFRELSKAEAQCIYRFYGIDVEALANETGMRLVVHGASPEKPRRVLLLSEGCYEVLHALVHKAKHESISYAGVRVFAFWTSKLFQNGNVEEDIAFRTTYEGAQHLAPFSNGKRILHLCVQQHRHLVFSLLDSGICINTRLSEAFRDVRGRPTVHIAECLRILQNTDNSDAKIYRPNHVYSNDHVRRDPNVCNEFEPGPLWIALHLKALRDVNTKACPEAEFGSAESNPPIVWLSGVLYFTRLELTTKEPIRRGISILLHQALSVRM